MKFVSLNLWNVSVRLWAVIELCWVLIFGVAAEASLAAELQIDFGFEQQAKVGCWTPVRVESSQADADSCEVEAVDPDGLQVVFPLQRATGDQAAAAAWSGIFRCGRLDANALVRLRNREGLIIAERRLSLPTLDPSAAPFLRQTVQRWLEVGFNTPLLESVPQVQALRSTDWPKLAEIPWSLDGIDGILISSQMPMSDQVAVELERWLRHGGQLLLPVTTDRDAFQKTRWAAWLTDVVDVRERTRTSDLSGVESFTVFSRKIPSSKLTPVTTFNVNEGRKLASCLEGPLLTRASFGFGQVSLIGLDLTQQPLSRWEGRSSLLKRLVFRSTDSANAKSSEIARLSQSGITDLASQWRAAAIDIPGIERPSLWGVLGLLLMYGLLIGPIDFVIVHKFFRRPHWTWVTLPLLVGVASIGTLSLARAVNGDAQQLTQLDVMDVDVNRQEMTLRSWATIYSDKNQRCRVEAGVRSEFANLESAGAAGSTNAGRSTSTENSANATSSTATSSTAVAATTGNVAALAAQVSWLGFPESAPGGLYRPSGFDLGQSGYRSSLDRQTLDNIPLGQWSSKSFTSEAHWLSTQPLVECRLTTIAANDLSGEIVHHFPFTLHDWVVAFEGRIFVPHSVAGEKAKTWEPNQPWNPTSSNVYGREMRGLLTRTKRTKLENKKQKTSEDILIEQERYDPLDLDAGDILQMMTLHEAAGGKAYTGLDHASLRAFDVTPLLSLDRAIMIARMPQPPTEWKLNGDARPPTQQHAYVRLLLPVKRVNPDTGGLRVLPKFEATPAPTTNAPVSAPVPTKTEPSNPVNNESSD